MAQMQRIPQSNTAVVCTDGLISVVLHSTLVVEATRDTIKLDTGGWDTVTTRARMNQASNQFGLGYRVYRDKGGLHVDTPHEGRMTFNGRMVEFRR